MRVTIDLPDLLHQKVKRLALEQGMTMRQFVVNAMERHLPQLYQEAVSDKRNTSRQLTLGKKPITPA